MVNVAYLRDFFAERAATTTATSWLVRRSGAKIVPYASHRRTDHSGWEVVLEPALEGFPTGDDLADTERLNAVLEVQIERSIDQYLWVHRRFKTRPPGAPPVYGAALLRPKSGNGLNQAGLSARGRALTLDCAEVIAPNLKRRLSGVTATIARLLPVQARSIGIVATGSGLPVHVPQVPLWSVILMSNSRLRVWHARRNHRDAARAAPASRPEEAP